MCSLHPGTRLCKTKVMLRRQTLQCQRRLHACATENLSPSVVVLLRYCLLSLNTPLVVFSAVLMVSSLQADDDTYDSRVGVGREKQQQQQQQKTVHMLCCGAILTQSDPLERKRIRENRSAQLLYPDRKETVRYLAVSQHSYFWTCPSGGGGGGGGGSLLACDTFGVCVTERSLFCLLINTGSDLV